MNKGYLTKSEIVFDALNEHIKDVISFEDFITIDDLAQWADEDEDTRAELAKIVTGRRSYRVSMQTLKKGLYRFILDDTDFRMCRIGNSFLITNLHVKRI